MLPTGNDGYISMHYDASKSLGCVLGFHTANAQTAYTSMVAGITIAAGGAIYKVGVGTGNLTNTTLTATNNTELGVFVTGSGTGTSYQLKESSDGGATWSNLGTAFGTRSANLYTGANLLGVTGSSLVEPKQFGLS